MPGVMIDVGDSEINYCAYLQESHNLVGERFTKLAGSYSECNSVTCNSSWDSDEDERKE